MSASEDPSRFAIFEKQSGFPLAEDHVQLQVLEWDHGAELGQIVNLERAADLAFRKDCALRIIFAPLDLPDNSTAQALFKIFNKHGVPSEFVSERLQAVAHSFGTKSDLKGAECSWFHFLCKNITLERSEHDPKQVQIKNPWEMQQFRSKKEDQSQADYSWIRAGFFLKSEILDATSPQVQSQDSMVTLICFGASQELVQRLSKLSRNPAWKEAIEDPYVLYTIILDELYLQLDGMAWRLNEVFGSMEKRVLEKASFPGIAAEKLDFVGLHNIAKHIIHLRESSDSILHTVDSIVSSHSPTVPIYGNSRIGAETHRALTYRKGAFNSTNMRLGSMEKRMQNLIHLSFNLVAQHDSKSFQVDNKLLMLIALLTLIFLPASTIASIFGSQFFVFDDGSKGDNGVDLKMSRQFWVFWVLVIPVTGVVLLAGWLYFKRVRRIVTEQSRPSRVPTWASENSGDAV